MSFNNEFAQNAIINGCSIDGIWNKKKKTFTCDFDEIILHVPQLKVERWDLIFINNFNYYITSFTYKNFNESNFIVFHYTY
jgi:hypothetical protein